MTECGQSYDSERLACINCHNYNKCDIAYCSMQLFFTDNTEEIEYYNTRIANNLEV